MARQMMGDGDAGRRRTVGGRDCKRDEHRETGAGEMEAVLV